MKKEVTNCEVNKEAIWKEAREKHRLLDRLVFEINKNDECYWGCSGGTWHSEWQFERGLSRDEVQKCHNTILELCEMVYGSKPTRTNIEDKDGVLQCIYFWEYDLYYYSLACNYIFDIDKEEYKDDYYFEISFTWGRWDKQVILSMKNDRKM